ncbi:MAG: type VI secretion system protein TssA [Gemmataceae bacterium]
MAASEPLIDFDTLLAPIPGDEPAGSSVPFDLRDKFEEDRKEDDPSAYAPDDPMRPETFKKADWPGIIKRAQEVLTKNSKDLLTSARLAEALVKLHGYEGCRDGIHLLRLLVEQCWDRLQPVIETPDDMDLRASPFNWLDDPDRGARFPTTLRAVPLLHGEDGPLSWLDWKQSQEGKGIAREDFDKAMVSTPLEQCQAALDALTQAVEDVNLLANQLKEKMGDVAPSMFKLRQSLEDCKGLAQHVVSFKGPAAGEEGTAEGGDGAAGEGKPATPGRAASTRAEAYRQLAQAAAVLQQLEPHSPIPYLVQRAVALGALSFPELMKAIIREENILKELSREFGIKSEEKSD